MRSFYIYAMIILILLILASGCRQNDTAVAVPEQANIREAVTVAEPQKAVDKIYSSLEEYKANPVTALQIEELIGIRERDVDAFYGKISDPTGGLSDVLIIEPKSDRREDVQLALSKYKEKRMAQFENYDILDAYPISQNAVIYDQGDYIIMLMLADNDAARRIIDEYIPL
ncbi:MAG: DUF4358 domain-containing protein [Oscillospiraceae bacterium]|nr:DUF4358 domain-containing protein [Oscillospiraceae bacterium]